MWHYSFSLTTRLWGIFWEEADRVHRLGFILGLALAAMLAFNRPMAEKLMAGSDGLPWWLSLVALGLLVGYGMLRANYERFHSLELSLAKERKDRDAHVLANHESYHRERQQWEKDRLEIVADHERAKEDLRRQVSELSTRLDNRARRVALRQQLGALLAEGQQLLRSTANESVPPLTDSVQAWAERAESFLATHLGADYVPRFSNAAGLPMGATMLASEPHIRLQGALRTRLARLEQFLGEVPRD